jgi:hypothetical protein
VKKVVLCLLAFVLVLSVPPTSSKSLGFSSRAALPEFVTVTVEARDEAGVLLDSPTIYAYSLDWGTMYPEYLWGTLENGAQITLPTGRWEFTAAATNGTSESEGYFLVRRMVVNASQKIVLTPDAEIDLEPPDSTSNLSLVNVLLLDNELRPLGKPVCVLSLGQSWIRSPSPRAKIYTSRGYLYSTFITADFARTSESIVIFEDEVKPNTIVKMQFNRGDLALISFGAYDKSLSAAAFHAWLFNPDVSSAYALGGPIYGTGSEKCYVSPGTWGFEFALTVDNWNYEFPQETIDAKGGSEFKFSYGGEFRPKLKAYKAYDIGQWCPEIANETMIFIETRDAFDNLLCEIGPPEEISIPLKLLRGGVEFFGMDLMAFDPSVALYGNAILLDLDVDNSPDYHIDLDLGPFNSFELAGKLFSAETSLEYETLETEHFRMCYPRGYKERFEAYGDFIDRIHDSLETYTGIQLEDKTDIKLFFGNAAGKAKKGAIMAGAAEVLRESPCLLMGAGMLYVIAHEHSHNFQQAIDVDRINHFFVEGFTEVLRLHPYAAAWGYPARLWGLTGVSQLAFEYIQEPDLHPVDPDNINAVTGAQTLANTQFVLGLLELKFGHDLQRRFLECWGMQDSPRYIPKSYYGVAMGDYETIAAVYSVLTGENLSLLFSQMGFKVDSSKIDQFMGRVRTSMTDVLPPFLVVDEPENQVTKSIYTSKSSLAITGRTEKDSSLAVNGTSFSLGDDGSFTCDVALNSGNNMIMVASTDRSGNASTESLNVLFDDGNPEVAITRPSEGSTTHDENITIRGVVSDTQSGVGQLTINNRNVTFYPDGSFTAILRLSKGMNTFPVIVEDRVGNRTSRVLTVVYATPVEPTPVQTIVLVLQVGNNVFTVNGVPSALDSPPVIRNSRTLVPVRAIIESLGGTVFWESVERKVTIALEDRIIELWVGQRMARANGVDIPIDATNPEVVPEIIGSRTMLPLRFVAESLGCDVQWNPIAKTVTVTRDVP